jgi:hypothetical protein
LRRIVCGEGGAYSGFDFGAIASLNRVGAHSHYVSGGIASLNRVGAHSHYVSGGSLRSTTGYRLASLRDAKLT